MNGLHLSSSKPNSGSGPNGPPYRALKALTADSDDDLSTNPDRGKRINRRSPVVYNPDIVIPGLPTIQVNPKKKDKEDKKQNKNEPTTGGSIHGSSDEGNSGAPPHGVNATTVKISQEEDSDDDIFTNPEQGLRGRPLPPTPPGHVISSPTSSTPGSGTGRSPTIYDPDTIVPGLPTIQVNAIKKEKERLREQRKHKKETSNIQNNSEGEDEGTLLERLDKRFSSFVNVETSVADSEDFPLQW